jgi:hypothetical protein
MATIGPLSAAPLKTPFIPVSAVQINSARYLSLLRNSGYTAQRKIAGILEINLEFYGFNDQLSEEINFSRLTSVSGKMVYL